MAVSESSRLSESLKKENVPVKRLIVNQILPPSASDCKFCAMKRKVFPFSLSLAAHNILAFIFLMNQTLNFFVMQFNNTRRNI